MVDILNWVDETENGGTIVEGAPQTALLDAGSDPEGYAAVYAESDCVSGRLYEIGFTVTGLTGIGRIYPSPHYDKIPWSGWNVEEQAGGTVTQNGLYAFTLNAGPDGYNGLAKVRTVHNGMVTGISYTIRFTVTNLVGQIVLNYNGGPFGGGWNEGPAYIVSDGTYTIVRTIDGLDEVPFGFDAFRDGNTAKISNVTVEVTGEPEQLVRGGRNTVFKRATSNKMELGFYVYGAGSSMQISDVTLDLFTGSMIDPNIIVPFRNWATLGKWFSGYTSPDGWQADWANGGTITDDTGSPGGAHLYVPGTNRWDYAALYCMTGLQKGVEYRMRFRAEFNWTDATATIYLGDLTYPISGTSGIQDFDVTFVASEDQPQFSLQLEYGDTPSWYGSIDFYDLSFRRTDGLPFYVGDLRYAQDIPSTFDWEGFPETLIGWSVETVGSGSVMSVGSAQLSAPGALDEARVYCPTTLQAGVTYLVRVPNWSGAANAYVHMRGDNQIEPLFPLAYGLNVAILTPTVDNPELEFYVVGVEGSVILDSVTVERQDGVPLGQPSYSAPIFDPLVPRTFGNWVPHSVGNMLDSWTPYTETCGRVLDGGGDTVILDAGSCPDGFASVTTENNMVVGVSYTIRFTVLSLTGTAELYSYGGWWNEGQYTINTTGSHVVVRTVAAGGDNIPFGFYAYGTGNSIQISNVTVEYLAGGSFYAPDLPSSLSSWTQYHELSGTVSVDGGGVAHLNSGATQWGLAALWHAVTVASGVRCIARFTVNTISGAPDRQERNVQFTGGAGLVGKSNVRFLVSGANVHPLQPSGSAPFCLTFLIYSSYYGTEFADIVSNVTLEREDGQPWVPGTPAYDPLVGPFSWTLNTRPEFCCINADGNLYLKSDGNGISCILHPTSMKEGRHYTVRFFASYASGSNCRCCLTSGVIADGVTPVSPTVEVVEGYNTIELTAAATESGGPCYLTFLIEEGTDATVVISSNLWDNFSVEQADGEKWQAKYDPTVKADFLDWWWESIEGWDIAIAESGYVYNESVPYPFSSRATPMAYINPNSLAAVIIPASSMKRGVAHRLRFFATLGPGSIGTVNAYDGTDLLTVVSSLEGRQNIVSGDNIKTITPTIDHPWVAFYVFENYYYMTLFGTGPGSDTHSGITIERTDGELFPLHDPVFPPNFLWGAFKDVTALSAIVFSASATYEVYHTFDVTAHGSIAVGATINCEVLKVWSRSVSLDVSSAYGPLIL